MPSHGNKNVFFGRGSCTPDSARNSSKAALLSETYAMFRALAAGKPLEDVRFACVDGKLFRQSARETRRRIWHALHWRFFAWTPPRWVTADLADAACEETTSPKFVGLVYLHYARRDRLTFDFVGTKLWPLWRSGSREVRRDDVLDFLAESKSRDSAVAKWRESTRDKLAGNVLSALRDFRRALRAFNARRYSVPVVAPEVALHLCRMLDAEGLRGRACSKPATGVSSFGTCMTLRSACPARPARRHPLRAVRPHGRVRCPAPFTGEVR